MKSIIKQILGILYQDSDMTKLSIGRITFIVLLIVAIMIWLKGNDIQPNMMLTLSAILTYVFGSKVTAAWASIKLNNQSCDETTTIVNSEPEENKSKKKKKRG